MGSEYKACRHGHGHLPAIRYFVIRISDKNSPRKTLPDCICRKKCAKEFDNSGQKPIRPCLQYFVVPVKYDVQNWTATFDTNSALCVQQFLCCTYNSCTLNQPPKSCICESFVIHSVNISLYNVFVLL